MKIPIEEAGNLLKQFHQLQEERVETYKLFNDGHTAYLKSAPNYNFTLYRQLVHEITETFKGISNNIINIETKFRELPQCYESISKCIMSIQKEEKRKLELTVEMQLLKQKSIDYPEEAKFKEELVECKESMKQSTEKIYEYLEELKYESEDILVSTE